MIDSSPMIIELKDKSQIYDFLSKNPDLHIYSIGDLDDFFWPYTKWYGFKVGNHLKAIVMVYKGFSLPTLLALCDSNELNWMEKLIAGLKPRLPKNFYCHLTPGLIHLFNESYQIESHGSHFKMGFKKHQKFATSVSKHKDQVINLTKEKLPAIKDLFNTSYPDNWFDERMLKTGKYFGILKGEKVLCVAGVHVYSEVYRMACLGNVVTDKKYLKNGYGKSCVIKLLNTLLNEVDLIGLNVDQTNKPAFHLYSNLGFEVIAPYEEYLMTTLS